MRISMTATLTRLLAALGALLAATAVYGQAQNAGRNLNVMAVNLDNHEIYSISFAPPGGTTTVRNTDQNNYVRPDALAFVTNANTQQLDLLVADNQRGTIYRYPGALAPQTPPNPTTGTLVWNASTSGTGPAAPDALAVDGYGNLFVANSTSGHSQTAQLWMFPVGAAGSGSFGNPVELDSSFLGKETLLEVALAPTDVAGAPGVAAGDLILLTTSRVLAYSQSSGYTQRITLLSFPNGSPVPGGMDFWPIGGAGANYSLLLSSNSTGVISRYYFTNPLTAAPAPFFSGLGALYKTKTLFQQGTPLLFVSQNGSILEFGANAAGNGTLMATVTQNVTVPQGLAVSNSFTNAASVCLQPGGCNLTGLLDHTLTGVSTLAGNIVENVCTVNADPRVSIVAGVWSCSVPYTPPAGFSCPAGTPPGGPGCLPVNAVCPGFDNTGTMALPDTLCGRSGSSGAGFSLIRTLIISNQFPGAYVENSAVLADGSNPACGPNSANSPNAVDGSFVWAPLFAEGTVFESPAMLDLTSGCGSIHAGSDGMSVWGVGFSVNEAAPELNPAGGLLRPLENFAQTKYSDLTTTIDNLTQSDPNHPRWTDAYPNVAAAVSLELWGGNVPPNVPPANHTDPFGCLDQSWLDFYDATRLDTDGSAQWLADLQNAANLLTNADATGNSTCDGIINYAEANSPLSAFVQTPNNTYPNAPTVLNPYGQLRSRAANLYYSINTRLLGNAASGSWPLPISINVLPTAVTLASGNSPGSATLSWNTNGSSGCTLTSSDGQYGGATLASPQPLTIPPGDAGTIVTYTVSCSGGPAASTVYAYVNVYPPPTLTLSLPAILLNAAATLTWNANHAQGCTTTTNDASSAAAFTGPAGSIAVSPASAGKYTYTLSCQTPNATVMQSLTVVAAPAVSISPSAVLLNGTGAMLTWNANVSSGCSWSSTDPALNGVAATTSPTAVNPAAIGTYSYTLSCNTPLATASKPVSLSVVQQPTVSLSPGMVIQGSGSTLSWTGNNNGCAWSSTDPGFNAQNAGSVNGNTLVKPTSAGSFGYTLTCPAPTQAATATLTVNAPQPPAISVSPNPIIQGSSSTLSWTINQGDVCTASSTGTDTNKADTFTGPIAASGSLKLTPNTAGSDTYSLNCTVPAVTESATLTVNPQLAVISISVTPVYDLDTGDPGILAWKLSNNPTGCIVSGTWPKYAAPQFSPFPVAASGSTRVTWNTAGVYTYTLSCTNPAAPAQTSVTITTSD